MAAAEITNTVLTRGSAATLAAGTAMTSDGAIFTLGADERSIIMFKNTSAQAVTVTLKAGDGVFGREDETVSVPASSTVMLALESGGHTAVVGTNKGKILATGSTDVQVSVIVLP